MLLRALSVSLVLLPAARALERVERRDFAVGSAPQVRLETYRGSIRVVAGAPGKVQLEIHEVTENGDAAAAAEAYRRLHLEISAAPGRVAVAARNPADTRARFLWEEKYKLSLSFVLTVPPDARLELLTADGGINVGDLSGSVSARARSGAIYLKHIGGDIDASDDEGEIVISRAGANVKLVDRVGEVRLGAVAGRLEARTLNADIDVQRLEGGGVVFANAGDVSFGIGGRLAGAVEVATTGGGIVLRLDRAARCEIHASSVWGHVDLKMPLAVTRGASGKGRLEATSNGGGPPVTLHANGGHIEIRPAKS